AHLGLRVIQELEECGDEEGVGDAPGGQGRPPSDPAVGIAEEGQELPAAGGAAVLESEDARELFQAGRGRGRRRGKRRSGGGSDDEHERGGHARHRHELYQPAPGRRPRKGRLMCRAFCPLAYEPSASWYAKPADSKSERAAALVSATARRSS